MKRKKMLMFAIPALLLGLIAMIHAGNRIIDTRNTNREGSSAYEELSAQVRKHTSTDIKLPDAGIGDIRTEMAADISVTHDDGAQVSQAVKTRIYIPDIEIDFEALREINNDSAAWLYNPGTVIDYPVFETDNYTYYISHLPDGTANANGSLFIDYNNTSDFSGPLTVIYGHHMKSGKMFGSLVGYKQQEFYDLHPYMYLYTEHENYRIDLMYGAVIGAGKWKEHAFMFTENKENLLAYAMDNTTFESDVEYKEGDRVVVLSTCSYEFNEARYIVVGILRPEWGEGVRS